MARGLETSFEYLRYTLSVIHHYVTEEDSSISRVKMLKKQLTDGYKKVIQCIKTGKKINKGPFRNLKNISVKNGLLRKGERIIVPENFQAELLKDAHGQHHLGIENTILMLKARF